MTQEGFKRKLTAILSADAVGYSRLMGEDEDTTVQTLKTYRDVISSLIKDHKGRVVDSPGDNILAEFVSVVNSLRCAWDVQQEIKSRNADLPENRRMDFRIGINLGDVIEEEDRIYGDGVNITARLESIAEEGGICISGTAYDQVKTKLPFRYEYQGEQVVKNIREPIRVYKVLIEKDVDELLLDKKLELPDKPSIAVLPFVNMSGDPEQEYFSDGITEGIITSISKAGDLFVIARTSSFKYKGQAVDVQQVGRELGVRYVMEGSVQRSGERIRVMTQLVDTKTGHHLWAERYDRDLKDIFAIQDEITIKILTALQVKLTVGEQARIHAKGTKKLEAYEKHLQGLQYIWRLNLEGNVLARQMFEEAIALDPEYAMAYALLGWTHLMDVLFGWSKSPDSSIEQIFKLAQKALALDDSLGDGHNLLGRIYLFKRQYEKAIAEGERSVALEPNNAFNILNLADTLRYAGRSEESIVLCKKALRLEPFPPSHFFSGLGTAYFLTGQDNKAIAACQKAIQRSPDSLFAHIVLAAAYGSSGRDEEARAEAAEVLRINPKFSIEYLAKTWPFKNKADIERYVDPLHKAGLPE
jgi:adenylate cyclase